MKHQLYPLQKEIFLKHYPAGDLDLLSYALNKERWELNVIAKKLKVSRGEPILFGRDEKAKKLIFDGLALKEALRDYDECSYMEEPLMIVPLDKISRLTQNLFDSLAMMLESVGYPSEQAKKVITNYLPLIKPSMNIEELVRAFVNNNNLTELKSTFRHVKMHWSINNPDEAKAGLGDQLNEIADFLDNLHDATRTDLRKQNPNANGE